MRNKINDTPISRLPHPQQAYLLLPQLLREHLLYVVVDFVIDFEAGEVLEDVLVVLEELFNPIIRRKVLMLIGLDVVRQKLVQFVRGGDRDARENRDGRRVQQVRPVLDLVDVDAD